MEVPGADFVFAGRTVVAAVLARGFGSVAFGALVFAEAAFVDVLGLASPRVAAAFSVAAFLTTGCFFTRAAVAPTDFRAAATGFVAIAEVFLGAVRFAGPLVEATEVVLLRRQKKSERSELQIIHLDRDAFIAVGALAGSFLTRAVVLAGLETVVEAFTIYEWTHTRAVSRRLYIYTQYKQSLCL